MKSADERADNIIADNTEKPDHHQSQNHAKCGTHRVIAMKDPVIPVTAGKELPAFAFVFELHSISFRYIHVLLHDRIERIYT